MNAAGPGSAQLATRGGSGSPPTPDPFESDKTLYDYWLICYRRRLSILLLVFTAIAGSLLISASLPSIYEARAMFYVPSSATTQRSNTGEQDVPLPASNQDDAKANIGILKGRDALRALHAAYPAKPIDALQRDVDFTAGRDGTIQIYVRDRNPALAAAVANAYIDYFNHFLSSQMRMRIAPRIESLRTRIADVTTQLHQVTRDRRAAANASGLALDGEARELMHSKEDLSKEVDDLRGSANARSESDQRGQSTRSVATAGVNELERQLASIEIELANVRARTLPNHPDQIALLDRQATAQAALQEKLRALTATDLSRADNVSKMIKSREKRLQTMPEAQAELADLDQQYIDLRAANSFLKRSLEDLTLNSARAQEVGINIERAFAPEVPVFPIAWLNAVIAAVLAVLAGILYALLLDYIAESAARRRERDIERT